jgi:plastocyanin
MRLAVTKRLMPPLFALALVAVACGGQPAATSVDLGSGSEFVPAIVDSVDDVGFMPSIAVSDNAPLVLYFGFPAELAAGEIPVTRSVSAPDVPSVLLASEVDGIFTRGAVAVPKPPPNLVTIPFGPAVEASVGSITPENVNGTSVAVDDDGGIHAAWVSDTGLWYAAGGASAPFSVERVVQPPVKLKRAGPIGPPAIAVDGDGDPWIAFGDDTGAEQAVRVATSSGGRWRIDDVASFGACGGCPEPRRVAIGVTSEGPVVAYSDPARDTPVAATSRGRAWTTQDIESAGGGVGLSMTVDGDGAPLVAYYTGDGSVHEAALRSGSWSTTTVGDAGTTDDAGLQTTGVAVDGDGTAYVTYYDGATDSVVLASDREGSYSAIDTPGTSGGGMPSVATGGKSEVFVSWFDHVNQNLDLGILGGAANELALAKPSPTTVASGAAPAPSATSTGGGGAPPCKSTGSEAELAAPTGAATEGFSTQCLSIDAGKPAKVTLDNQDAGVPHNWALFEDSGYTKPVAATQLTPGPATEETEVPALKQGTFYYHCDAHPATMTGQLYVA